MRYSTQLFGLLTAVFLVPNMPLPSFSQEPSEPQPAIAQSESESNAKQLLDLGVEQFEVQDFETALLTLQQALEQAQAEGDRAVTVYGCAAPAYSTQQLVFLGRKFS